MSACSVAVLSLEYLFVQSSNKTLSYAQYIDTCEISRMTFVDVLTFGSLQSVQNLFNGT